MNLNLRHRTHAILYLQFLFVFPFVLVLIAGSYVSYADTGAVIFVNKDFVYYFFVIFFGAPLMLLLSFNFWIYRAMKQRDKNVSKAALSKGMSAAKVQLSPSILELAEGKIDWHERNNFASQDWGFTDFQFSHFITDKRRRRHKVRTYYYAVASFQLPRSLPNVFFDSKHTGSREFKKLFKASQKHSLEGNFDQHFTTYFHEEYRIDNMSFITPDVMEALLFGKNYDIEIYQDKLFLYNELEDMPWQLNDIEHKGKLIREKLLNNILTYRDERIHFDCGRKMVSLKGIKLRRSVAWAYAALGISVGAILLGCWGLFFENGRFIEVSLYVIAFGFSMGFIKYKKLLEISKDEAVYNK